MPANIDEKTFQSMTIGDFWFIVKLPCDSAHMINFVNLIKYAINDAFLIINLLKWVPKISP